MTDRAKWFVLGFAALANMAAYYTYDAIAPIADMLRDQRGFSQSEIGLLNAVYSLPNIPLALVGGVLIDRIGAARAAFAASALCLAGAVMTAIGEPYSLMVAGRLIFGVGSETLYIALLVGIAQWFSLGGAALAMALFFSVARVGSYSADTSPHWAADIYAQGWQAPLWLSAGLCAAGLVAALAYLLVDRNRPPALAVARPAERMDFRQLRGFSASFWAILWLNVLFASVFFPFRSTFSIQFFQDARGLSLAEAGITNSWVFFAAIFATPLFGIIADRVGRRATLLAVGASLMPLTFAILALTDWSLWLSTILMGISFSVIPAVIWPSTAMLVERHRVGTAFGLINMIQSLGLSAANYAAGWLNDRFAAGPDNPDGYMAMLAMFAALSLVALAATLYLLRRERRQPGGGIEARRVAGAGSDAHGLSAARS